MLPLSIYVFKNRAMAFYTCMVCCKNIFVPILLKPLCVAGTLNLDRTIWVEMFCPINIFSVPEGYPMTNFVLDKITVTETVLSVLLFSAKYTCLDMDGIIHVATRYACTIPINIKELVKIKNSQQKNPREVLGSFAL